MTLEPWPLRSPVLCFTTAIQEMTPPPLPPPPPPPPPLRAHEQHQFNNLTLYHAIFSPNHSIFDLYNLGAFPLNRMNFSYFVQSSHTLMQGPVVKMSHKNIHATGCKIEKNESFQCLQKTRDNKHAFL